MGTSTAGPSARNTSQPSARDAASVPHGDAIRLIVVDAHPLMRWALIHIADDKHDLVTVGEAAEVTQAMALVDSLRPDVVAIGCSLPGEDGWTFARALRDRYPSIGTVIVAANGSDTLLFRALDCGASAFVSQASQVHDVVCAIRHAAVSPSAFSAPELAQALRRRRDVAEQPILSPREQQVLYLLCNGLSGAEVAGQMSVSVSTAKTYMARLYEKLGASNKAQALMAGVRLGLVHEDSPAPQPRYVA